MPQCMDARFTGLAAIVCSFIIKYIKSHSLLVRPRWSCLTPSIALLVPLVAQYTPQWIAINLHDHKNDASERLFVALSLQLVCLDSAKVWLISNLC